MKTIRLGMLLSIAMSSALLADSGPWSADYSHDTGKVLNIYCWNDEFRNCMIENYPGYKDNRDGSGRIGDVKVNWVIENGFDTYQDKLDVALERQNANEDDQKVDLFLLRRIMHPNTRTRKAYASPWKNWD